MHRGHSDFAHGPGHLTSPQAELDLWTLIGDHTCPRPKASRMDSLLHHHRLYAPSLLLPSPSWDLQPPTAHAWTISSTSESTPALTPTGSQKEQARIRRKLL